jgi:ketosteroid isomerase-like protein
MTKQASTDEAQIRSAVREINDYWRAGQYDRIGARLADDAVIAPPGFGGRVRGRAAYIQSYRDYDQAATTLEFSAGEPQVDVVGDVAVAVTAFDVVYEVRGARHHENGHDILVLSRLRGQWTVVWRTMQVAPTEGRGSSLESGATHRVR